MGFPIVNTPFARNCGVTFHLHFISTWNSAPSRRMAGNYPRIPGITLGLGLVHYPLLPVTHRLSLLVQSGRSAPPSWQTLTERRTACPSSDGTTRGQDGPCFKDRRACCSPWTTPCEGSTTRELTPARINSATRLQLTVPRSSLSLIRFAFRHRVPNRCYSAAPVF